MPTVIKPEAASTQTGFLRGRMVLASPNSTAPTLTIPGPAARSDFASGGAREHAMRVGDRTRLLAVAIANGLPTTAHKLVVVGWIPAIDVMIPVSLGRFLCYIQNQHAVGQELRDALGDGAPASVHYFCDTYTPTVGADYPYLLGSGSNNDDAPSGPIFEVRAFEYVEVIARPSSMLNAASAIATLF